MTLTWSCPAALAEEPAKLPPPEGAQRLDPRQPIWIDRELTRVMVDGRVVLREGVLEMFACPASTKEHESVVAVDAKAFLIHTGLLRVGAVEGTPVRFDPEYQAPTGTEIEVQAEWYVEGVKKTARAQEWVRNANTGEQMKLPFVFAGSGFWTDPDSGKQHYLAESGDLICVSNFSAAMLDVPAPSTQANGELWFEPFTERIPPIGTPVRLVLTPKTKEPKGKAASGDEKALPKQPAESSAEPEGDTAENPEAGDLGAAIETLRGVAVGEGASDALQASWRVASRAAPDRLVDLLAAMKDASPLAEGWLRTAIDAVADRAGPGKLPVEALSRFVGDDTQSPRARRTALEMIRRADDDLANEMLDDLLHDSSTEIRYDAVEKVLLSAAEAPEAEREQLYMVALSASRSIDQIETAGRRLKDLGREVSLVEALGFVTEWHVTGPFDNREGAGFGATYAPEEKLDASASYTGADADGEQGPFAWETFTTNDRLGQVDLNEPLGRHKGAVGYAWATVASDAARDVELRYASIVATKVWLNGRLIAEHETYHSGSAFDQFVVNARLQAGDNQLLVKACQNEQTDSWAEEWPFQLRLTGPGGDPLEGIETRPGGVAPPAAQ